MKSRCAVLLLLATSASACTASVEDLRPRAALDLRCPEEEIRIHDFPGDAAGARGCGRQMTTAASARIATSAPTARG
ncbi:MAG TPA: hypothetical protein RMH99_25355 [Sandaracinaceae bacterium LLY-WYZ-13_1]|nr:hypothetical protein [Sandaracinaceae bacterium LLY-WYZ-13_1]